MPYGRAYGSQEDQEGQIVRLSGLQRASINCPLPSNCTCTRTKPRQNLDFHRHPLKFSVGAFHMKLTLFSAGTNKRG